MHKGVVALKERGQWINKIAQQADLIGEPLPGQPLVELYGDNRLLIERHGGVVQYQGEEICVKVPYGILCVIGSGLELARMCRDQLVITGKIDGLKIMRRS